MTGEKGPVLFILYEEPNQTGNDSKYKSNEIKTRYIELSLGRLILKEVQDGPDPARPQPVGWVGNV